MKRIIRLIYYLVLVAFSLTKKAEAASGSISVDIQPADAIAAGARVRGVYVDSGFTQNWNTWGYVEATIGGGVWRWEFLDIPNWTKPANFNTTMTLEQNQEFIRSYTPFPWNINITIDPASAVTAGAQWRLTSGPDTSWKESSATISNLTGPQYTCEFRVLEFWETPASFVINRTPGQTSSHSVNYTAIPPALLTITFNPESAISDGAAWRIVGLETNWLSSGNTSVGLMPGTYSVEFRSLDGWLTPEPLSVTLSSGQNGVYTVNYDLDVLTYNAGVVVLRGNAYLDNCKVEDFSKHGIYVADQAFVELSNTMISGSRDGGAFVEGHISATASTFLNNKASLNNEGGGVRIVEGGVASFTNCVFVDNTANRGAGIYSASNSVTLLNHCTLTANVSSNDYGGALLNGSGTVINTIVWGNGQPHGYDAIFASGIAISNSCVLAQLTPSFANSTTNNPMFSQYPKWHLDPGSACIDYSYESDITTDITGSIRPFNASGFASDLFDIGAHEFSGPLFPVGQVWFSPESRAVPESNINVIVSSSTPDVEIYYTVNNCDADESGVLIQSGTSLLLPIPTTLRARAYKRGYLPSDQKHAYYEAGTESGIPISWLISYALPTDGSVDHECLDGNRFTVMQAWVAGLNPHDSSDMFLLNIAQDQSDETKLKWHSVSGRVYSIFAKDSLTSPWPEQPIYTVTGNGDDQFMTLDGELELGAKFFLIRVSLP